MIDGYYAALIYDDGTHFKVFRNIEDMPDRFSKDHVRPITWAEFFYTVCYEKSKEVVGLVTRYPITGIGSIYPSTVFLKTTVTGQRRIPLNYAWEVDDDRPAANEMPIAGESFMDSLAVHQAMLANLGGDFDGDTCSFNILFSKQAIAEVRQLLSSKAAFIDPRGGFTQAITDTVEWALLNMTR
jgi:hypothetical protein